MFRELAPLLRQRAVLLTITHLLENDQIRVNVMPKQLASGENSALTIPFSLTGSPIELDEQLPQAIVEFVAKHLETKNTLEAAKAEMDAAAKTARDEARSKTKSVTKKANSTVTPKPEIKPEASKPTTPPSLFDSLSSQPVSEKTEEEEILKEIQENEHTSSEPAFDQGDDLEDESATA